jgi:hypothetical protein
MFRLFMGFKQFGAFGPEDRLSGIPGTEKGA